MLPGALGNIAPLLCAEASRLLYVREGLAPLRPERLRFRLASGVVTSPSCATWHPTTGLQNSGENGSL